MCMPLKLATTRDCGGGVQFNAVITGIFIMVAVKFFFVPQETDIIKNGEKILWNFMQAMS